MAPLKPLALLLVGVARCAAVAKPPELSHYANNGCTTPDCELAAPGQSECQNL